MNFKSFLKENFSVLLFHSICIFFLSLFLIVIGNSIDSIFYILCLWVLIECTTFLLKYYYYANKIHQLINLNTNLEKKYLISEVLPKPTTHLEKTYHQIIKSSCKSMLEEISNLQQERQEYKEYIEQWIHEVKTPITAIKLLCENNRNSLSKELMMELEKISQFTEQALYYARSEYTEKDYFIQEIALFPIVHQTIMDNKYLLMQKQFSIEIQESPVFVYSDEKWIRFILNQIISNTIKYHSQQPSLKIYTKSQQDKVILYIEDNGIGISPQDLPRIFDKGFTGENGRVRQNSTGLGLYLCQKLCHKLGMDIKVSSQDTSTQVRLFFQINHFIQQIQ